MRALFVNHEAQSQDMTKETVQALKAAATVYNQQIEKPKYLLLNSQDLAELAWENRDCQGIWFPGLLKNELDNKEKLNVSCRSIVSCNKRTLQRELRRFCGGEEEIELILSGQWEVLSDPLYLILFRIVKKTVRRRHE